MSNSYTIGDLFSMYYENEISSVEDIELPDFSAQHKRKMKKAFRIFDRNKAVYCNAYSTSKIQSPLSVRKRILIAVMIVLFLAVATGCIVAYISNSFHGTVYSDNTELFAFNNDHFPATIEKEYTLLVVPDGYELYKATKSEIHVSTVYKNSENDLLIFEQTVKDVYDSHINTEGYTIQQTSVGGCDAVCLEYNRHTGTESMVVWNNEDYILQLHGTFTKNELIELANNNENAGY